MTLRSFLQANKVFLSCGAMFILISSLYSCGGKPSADPCCSFSDLPPGADIKAGQGALQVEGSTSATFYVFDERGKQVNYQTISKTLTLDPGKYQIKVNNSSYPVVVKEGTLAKCSTGTVMVSGTTSETYYVMDTLGTQLTYDQLGKGISLFASSFVVKLNNSEVHAEVKLNQVTEIRSGTLVVHGNTNEAYYVLDALGKQLNYNTLEKPLAFLKGSYTVKVNNTVTKAAITNEQLTELWTGTLIVHGVTNESYYVLDATGNQLNYNTLEKPLAFLPGSYNVKLNNTLTKADIVGEQLTELISGTLLVKGLTDESFYAYDSLGTQLNYQTLNKSLSFFPCNIQIKVNNTERTAKIVKGKISEFGTGSVMVSGSGDDNYYVLDKTGNQLNYNSLNKSLSLFAAEYTIKLGLSTRKATVKEGQLTTVASFKY